ncbi:MAG: TIGR03960 family B12-binding radical SAM protein [Firmicutes bacterium]|nr:TIGR03960 family B12-binding radical SAM protein [Bacillota bacterium]
MEIDRLLLKVSQPSRYAGGEFGGAAPKPGAPLRFLLCFPDAYEVGFSNLGIKILYGLLNERADCSCELCFAPWPDMGTLLKQHKLPLFSLASRTPAKDFDIIGFSLSYELGYTNIPYMLDLAGIPLYAADRSESEPIIMGGGMCMINPAPLAPFFDLICVGDGEEALAEVADIFVANKAAGGDKRAFLERAASVRGIYVPKLGIRKEELGMMDGDEHNDSEQKSSSLIPNSSFLIPNSKIKRAAVEDLDSAYFPTRIPIPNAEAVHSRAVLELFRGCSRGCRFCQGGFVGRPVRYKKPETLARIAAELIRNTGYDEISLSSLSSCDYPMLRELLEKMKPVCEKSGVKISLPSTRVDSFAAEFTESARKGSMTFAPEAGTQALRDVINKDVTEEEILSSCVAAFKKGFSTVKLYFMTGLPTETDEDIDGIVELCKKIKPLYKQHASNRKGLSIGVSVATFVPKPFTPFQWEKQISPEEIARIHTRLKNALRSLGVRFSAHDAGMSKAEAALARGGEELARVIEAAYKAGGVFDGWNEHFNFARWQNAFDSAGLNIEDYSASLDPATPLPWDIIDAGIDKAFLLRERARAYEGKVSGGCAEKCSGCGIQKFDAGSFKKHCRKKK